tara:strand:- start:15472 stop:17889 length:2418 start_codon:yes stop_codon:yes gene_type:complete
MEDSQIVRFKKETKNNYNFSDFQVNACNGILNNKHVLVTAHTGSGKTLPAEFAIFYYITVLKKKVIYTSPIKALSNQKFKEFTEKFQNINIGILTGDIKHNPSADLLIMTTEILQNHCFKIKNQNLYLDFNIDIDNELGCVIFDEVHYIDDKDRGTVWEQTIIMLPDHIPFVMLSATIGEKETFANWIETIKNKKVIICESTHRVVPLTFYEYFTVPDKYIKNIKDKKKKEFFLNKNKFNIIKNLSNYNYKHLSDTKKCIIELNKDQFRIHSKYVLNDCLEHLKNNDMFPCLLFIFSRKQVENIASQIFVDLFLKDEKDYQLKPIFIRLLVNKVSNWKEYVDLPECNFYIDLLEKGIGVHHAGMLPIFREIMEILYEQKYIKILIATETFAIGLNMPTRTVLFNSLYKFDGSQKRLIKSHEFIQMAGRAGRRNIDKVGHVLLLTNNYEPVSETDYFNLFNTKPKILKSKFKITYNLLLNYLSIFTKEEFIKMVEKSLMYLDIRKFINSCEKNIEVLETKLNNYTFLLKDIDFDYNDYFYQYEELLFKVNYSKNKEKKRLVNIVREYENNTDKFKYYDQYKNIQKIKKDIQIETSNLNYAKNYIKSQINILFNILKDNQYIDENENILISGTNASYIHELPCLIFYDMYNMFNKFDNHTESNILAILSCFYDLKVNEEYKQLTPLILKEEINYIHSRINYYSDIELKNEIYINSETTIQYDIMDNIVKWYNSIETIEDTRFFFDNLKKEKDIFIGDFIKCCMKIVNMCNELKILCENDNNYKLLEKINSIQEKLQKSIVSNKSLYV